MRKLWSATLVALALLTIPSALSATTKNVDITAAGFTPKTVTIDFGDTVTWTNKDSGSHQVLADQLAFPTSPVLAQNQTYSYTFTKSGSFGYRDALHTNRRGTVVVRGGVTLKAAPALISYGGATTLSGVVSSGAAGETVNVDAKQCGATTFTRVVGVKSTANGAWSAPVKPAMNTVYRASWKNANSPDLAQSVSPLLTLKRVRAGRFTAGATAAIALTGKRLVVQRYVKSKRTWKSVKQVTLNKSKPGTPPSVRSSVAFGLRIPRGTKLRVLLPAAQAATCYAAARSAAIRA
ncbi:MAG TPA: cupredoxin domain-containing protein [Gaiellaceae bacterium]|nr:cupredoxin domain-containing protein [Gaiellaceae bacterium]